MRNLTRRWRCKKLLTDFNMNCFPALIMSASFGLGRFREINTSKTVLDSSAALSSRRNRRGDDFSRTAARRPPQGTHCASALHFSDRIRFCLYYSTLPRPTQQNFYFVALEKRTTKRTKNSRVLYSVISDTGYFGAISPVFILILGNL